MKHLSDQQLIDVHYLAASGEEAQHLEGCAECSERLITIRGALQRAALTGMKSVEPRSDSFWLRQRMAIDNAIDRREAAIRSQPTLRWGMAAAAAALLVIGLFSVPRFFPSSGSEPVVAAATPTASPASSTTALDVIEDISSLEDPWESEELRPFGAAVEWETWDSKDQTRNNS